ncbi:Mannan endo-1,4-beta-mannosidase 2 [Capsicum chinense]|nr:Mannan endo-1,4-beta-mannosidase 2 [Capsicum chinense]
MSESVKSLDQKHLVTVGLEGFYGVEKTGSIGLNPGKWAASLGVDFIANSAIDNIDFTSVHAYPTVGLATFKLILFAFGKVSATFCDIRGGLVLLGLSKKKPIRRSSTKRTISLHGMRKRKSRQMGTDWSSKNVYSTRSV